MYIKVNLDLYTTVKNSKVRNNLRLHSFREYKKLQQNLKTNLYESLNEMYISTTMCPIMIN